MRLLRPVALLSLLAIAPAALCAGEDPAVDVVDVADAVPEVHTVPRWEWGLALAAAHLRDYPGSSHNDTYALPLPWFVWRSERVEVGREGGRGILYRTPQRELSFTLVANPPANNDDNPERAGMQSLDAVVEPGLRMRWRFPLGDSGRWRVGASLPVRYAVAVDEQFRSHGLGVHAEPGLSLDRTMEHGWSWGLSASVGFAEAGYSGYYYGVTAADATAARPVYDAPGGYSGWSANTRLMYRQDRLSTGVFLRYENIADASFAGSPLVTTDHGVTIGYLLSLRLGESQERIARQDP